MMFLQGCIEFCLNLMDAISLHPVAATITTAITGVVLALALYGTPLGIILIIWLVLEEQERHSSVL
jgi:hypothetical protein